MTVLMAVGGNMQLNGQIAQDFIRRSGGPESRLVILPTASSRLSGGCEYLQAWMELGLKQPPIVLPVRDRSHAFDGDILQMVQQASGIFFTGGTQLRLTTVLAGTPLLASILDGFRRGVVVAGTSAGAAVMGRVMIATGKTGSGGRFGIAQFAEGLGLVNGVLFDQHFYQRNRVGRLIYAVTVQPDLLGIGIDEDTAVVLEDDEMVVVGKRSVTIIDGQDIKETNVDQVSSGAWFSVSQLRLHQLTAGCRFNLTTRTASILREPMQPD